MTNSDEPYFIAEISSNHNQSLERIEELIITSKALGFHAVKFQIFKIEELFSKEVLESSPEHSARKAWELPKEFIPKIYKICKDTKIDFGITPFYIDAVKENEEYVDFFKIASYEILWKELFHECLSTKKPLIFSSGMATLNEVDDAIAQIPDSKKKDITLLHCSSAYPTSPDSCNLSIIKMFKERYACKVGWSDHTCSKAVVLSSLIQWNAECVELHIDIDGKGAEAASGHCWLPSDLRDLFSMYYESLKAEGQPIKQPNIEEEPDREWRADPSDGLRPLKKIRKLVPEIIKSANEN